MTEPLDSPSLDGLNRLSQSAAAADEPMNADHEEIASDGEHGSDDTTPTSSAKRHARGLLDWIVVIGIALFVAFVVRTFVLGHFVVDGDSMMTTLHDGDRVFVNKLSYRLHEPNRGDVVVLHELDPGAPERDLIKRVIALEGETIEMRNCEVRIDGELLDEPYLDPAEIGAEHLCGRDFGPVVVEQDHVFVMGDNRDGSLDSRDIGSIDVDDLVGRAFVVFWPTSQWRWL